MSGSDFGLAPATARQLRRIFQRFDGIAQVWVYGSRARGDHRENSDVDLMVDAPGWDATAFARLWAAVQDERFIEGIDLAHWQQAADPGFKDKVQRERRVFWSPAPQAAAVRSVGSIDLKDYQSRSLEQLDAYLDVLVRRKAKTDAMEAALLNSGAAEDMPPEALQAARDYPKAAWDELARAGALPQQFAARPHSSRFDGAGRAIPNVCFKVPTGGGKTLLAAASVGHVFEKFFGRSAGLVLWVVPKEAIYRQTLKALKNPDHPYRQMLNVAGAGRVKILEKGDPLSRIEVESQLCVMVLMLAAASRQSQETLRFFRDRGNVHGFVPREDDTEAHWELLRQVPNLDVYASPFADQASARAQKGSIVKSSLGNVMRLVRPMVVIDEGQYGYSPIALKTIDGFNPGFMLELSATPRVADANSGGSNILVDVRGTDLEAEQMIKLPIQVEVRGWADWQSCVAASVEQLRALDREAELLREETERYVRPILLVQVERTGKDQVDPAHIHARDVRDFLGQLGFADTEVREKTSDKDEIADEELMSPASRVRVIITKQALQEGWDCPFAYILCALAASRGKPAMTQLVGRILRQPQVTKTGHAALDRCYVFCHDIRTGEVVHAIRKSLEGEGMGDLVQQVTVSGGSDPEAPRPLAQKRRDSLRALRIFLPTVTWVEPDGRRRPLVYESDILAAVPWERIDAGALAPGWQPGEAGASAGGRFVVDLRVLQDESAPLRAAIASTQPALDASVLVRGLLDLVPNAWLAWEWVEAVLRRLCAQHDDRAIAASAATLVETLREGLAQQRDALAQEVFDAAVRAGRIQFRLRADATDYELPHEDDLLVTGDVRTLTRGDGVTPVEKSLLQPAVRTPDINDFEAAFAGYLDDRAALRWWHRNVAKAHYGLQGWKRHKVYPDFVFGFDSGPADGQARVVLIETKGAHLAGNADTAYKQLLLARLTEAFCDERLQSTGLLELEAPGRLKLVCDLVVDANWRAAMDSNYFPAPPAH